MKYLICNLKAHKNYSEMLSYKEAIRSLDTKNLELILAPSSIYLSQFTNEDLKLCTQDIPLNESLALTGDITIEQLISLNVKYAIIGHYDRQKYYHENEHMIIAKIQNALKNNLKVIYCIGETREELARKVEYQVLEKKIARILNNIPKEEFKNIIIAYEPTYMIGGGTPLNVKKIAENIHFIKNIINSYYHGAIKVVYGGNINKVTIKEFNKIKELDGFIIGNACLDPFNLKSIINEIK